MRFYTIIEFTQPTILRIVSCPGSSLRHSQAITRHCTLLAIHLKNISLPFSLLINPRQLRQLLMFHGWEEGGAVEVDEHDAATLFVPEYVGIALVAMVINTAVRR